ncbi:TrmH family RNA methyltransferase, partial [Parasutterella excrementihominis]
VTNIALSPQCAYVWSPKVLRAAMGAHFFCNIISSVELAEIKEKTGAVCLVADARGGKDLYEEKWGKGQTLWVFGSEGLGVSEKALELSDLTLLIPLDSRVESLNVATAASVCLFEQRRRRLSGIAHK